MDRDRVGAARQRPFRRRNVDPAVGHERGVKAGRSRTTVDYFLRKLTEAAEAGTLTAEHRQRLADLLDGDAA